MRIKYSINITYHKGKYHNVYIDNILKQIDNIKNGVLDGECKTWHENGQVCVYCNYKNDKFDGEFKSWYENGNLQIYDFYKNGKEDGIYIYYSMNSIILAYSFYKNGKKIKEM